MAQNLVPVKLILESSIQWQKSATQNNLKLMGEWRYRIHILNTLQISLKQQPPDCTCVISSVCFKSMLKWLMYISRITVFPNAQFNFSLVTLMGNKMKEFTTGGEYWLSGAQPSFFFFFFLFFWGGILYNTLFTLSLDVCFAFATIKPFEQLVTPGLVSCIGSMLCWDKRDHVGSLLLCPSTRFWLGWEKRDSIGSLWFPSENRDPIGSLWFSSKFRSGCSDNKDSIGSFCCIGSLGSTNYLCHLCHCHCHQWHV